MKSISIAVLALMLTCGAVYSHTDLGPEEVKAWLHTGDPVILVDVREESEFCDTLYSPPGHIPRAVNMPWNSGYFTANYEDLPLNENIITVCRSGNRSNSAANFLDSEGFTSVFDMTGGMNAWLWETEDCTSASVPGPGGLPGFSVRPAVPNPFTSETRIGYFISGDAPAGPAVVRIYDCLGRMVTAIEGGGESGPNEVVWEGMDDHGRPVASGLYFYRVDWNGRSLMRRVVLLR
jgi:rhodanese-related sulfurtransferase